jgi:eukaryotic-like serine/threonine-protein kinase
MPTVPTRIGKYEILAQVGRGGMGTVYKARDPILERTVALKTMFKDVLSEHGMRERFLREARSAARLQHPNIVTIFEFGEVDEVPFIAMEFLVGEDLQEARKHDRFPDMPSKLAMIIQVCDALAYAHSNGVVHRDVKPSNVTVLPTGTIKLVDFGIARMEGGTMATRTGEVLGTPSYMAPEQFTGHKVDHHVDMWATGVLLYELIAGHRPFSGPTVPSLIYQILHAPPPPLQPEVLSLPTPLAKIVERALDKDPGQRFADMAAMARALREVRAEILNPARLPTATEVEETSDMELPSMLDSAGSLALPRPISGSQRPPSGPARTPAPRTPTTRHSGYIEDGSFGEPRKVQVITLTPDETMLVVGGTDGSIRLWDLERRQKLETFRNRAHMRSGTGSMTTCLAFSDDETLLASGHLDGAIYLWELASGLELDVKLGHDGAVGGLAFPPGDAVLISGGADAAIKFWDLDAAKNRDARRTMRRQPDAVLCLALAKMGQVVVTGHSNRSLRVHDTRDQRLVATIHGHKAPLAVLVVSADGTLVASGGRDGTVHVHHLDSRELLAQYREHTRAIAGLAFFPGGQRVASVAMDNTVVVHDTADPENPLVLAGASDEAFASVAVNADGRRLIAATMEGRFRIWLLQA